MDAGRDWQLGHRLAQVGAGSWPGASRDQAGAAVPGATVTRGPDKHQPFQNRNHRPGRRFRRPGSPRRLQRAWSWPDSARSCGTAFASPPVRRSGGPAAGLGGVTEAVTVTADAPLVRRNLRTGPGDRQQEDRRSAAQWPELHLACGLAPSVRCCRRPRPLPRINGGRAPTRYLFDGISVLQPEAGQVAFFPNIDAIQEFKSRATVRRRNSGASSGVVN